MKLLICTQKVDINDDLLGFFHSWIQEFSKNCEQVTVICLYKGDYDLPDNVKVLSLGKEKINQKATGLSNRLIIKLLYFFNFYKYIWQERKNYDSIFVHMNPIYVLLGGVFWQMWRKKIGLWFAHGHVPWELKIAERFVDDIFTASSESVSLKSNKIKVIGHGIDIKQFKNQNLKYDDNKFKIIYDTFLKNGYKLVHGDIDKYHESSDKDFKIIYPIDYNNGWMKDIENYCYSKCDQSQINRCNLVGQYPMLYKKHIAYGIYNFTK